MDLHTNSKFLMENMLYQVIWQIPPKKTSVCIKPLKNNPKHIPPQKNVYLMVLCLGLGKSWDLKN